MFSRINDLRIHGKTQNKKEKSTPSIADTVVGSFTDEDLILSELNMYYVSSYCVMCVLCV